MLVVYINGSYKKYFETTYSDKLEIPKEVYYGNFNIDVSKYDYIVGNDLCYLNGITPNQVCIDVCKFGLNWILLEKYNLEAIVYAYNNWFITGCPYMAIDEPFGKYTLRDIPSDAKYSVIKLLTGAKRFDQIRNEISMASKSTNFIGAIWPTCHYLSDTSSMWIVYGNVTMTIRQNESKPALK